MTIASDGTTIRRSRNEILFKRSLLTREYVLCLNKNLCDGCGLCSENCPKEAIVVLTKASNKGKKIIEVQINEPRFGI